VSVGEILEEAIGLEPARWTRGDQMRVSAYLKANGWERYRRRDEGGREAPREWRYRRPLMSKQLTLQTLSNGFSLDCQAQLLWGFCPLRSPVL
jgi:hypothetical protein